MAVQRRYEIDLPGFAGGRGLLSAMVLDKNRGGEVRRQSGQDVTPAFSPPANAASAITSKALFGRCRERPRCCSVAVTSGPVAVVRDMARLSASRLFYHSVCCQTHGVCTVADMTAGFFL
jgi:hypothetical protein